MAESKTLDRAEEFMLLNARLLERRLFALLFRGEAAEPALQVAHGVGGRRQRAAEPLEAPARARRQRAEHIGSGEVIDQRRTVVVHGAASRQRRSRSRPRRSQTLTLPIGAAMCSASSECVSP